MKHLQINKTLKLFMLQLNHRLKVILISQHLVGQDFMHRMWQWGAIVCIFYVLEGTVVHTLDNTDPERAKAEELNKEPKVVGGKPAAVGQFPYQVLIKIQNDSGVYVCGGAIIAEQYVLTATHCVLGIRAANVKVQAGNIDLRTEENWIHSSVSEVYVHEDYFPKPGFYNDIALLKLRESFTLDGKLTASLKLRDTEVSIGVLCRVTGWGLTKKDGELSNTLQYADVQIVDRKTCSVQHSTELYPGQICAGYSSDRRDSCKGDSGGPLVCEGTLTGLVSWGDDCDTSDNPGVYTNVVWYKEWIEKKTAPLTNVYPPSGGIDVPDVSKPGESNMTNIETSSHRVIFVLSFITLLRYLVQ